MKKILFALLILAVASAAEAGQRVDGQQNIKNTCLAATTNGAIVYMDRVDGLSFQAVYTNVTSTAPVIAAAQFAVVGSTVSWAGGTSFCTGEGVWIATSGAMPTGLTAGTTYYTIAGNPFQLAATSTGAVAGLALAWTTQGSGNQTFNFIANTGNSLRMQGSNDSGGGVPANWTDIAASSTTLSGSGSNLWNYSATFYRYIRPVYNAVWGAYNMTVTDNGESLSPGQ
jgi:hypothetical protein